MSLPCRKPEDLPALGSEPPRNEVVNRVARRKGGIEVDQRIEPEPPRRPFRFDAHHAHRVIDP
jgi:hypothetical protein